MAYNVLFRGNRAQSPSRSFSTGYQNGTLNGLLKSVPVSVDTNGQLVTTDVSNETQVKNFVGLTGENIPSGANGQVISGGRFDSAFTSEFNLGDALWIGKNATIINQTPIVGQNGFQKGDFVVFLGVVVKNEFNINYKDIQLMIEVIGQL